MTKADLDGFKLPTPPASPPLLPDARDFESHGFRRFIELLVGTVAFLALCISLIFLVLPIGVLLDGGASEGIYRWLFATVLAVAVSGAVLFLTGRKSRAYREAVAQNPIARQFARRKLILYLSISGLIGLVICAIVLIKRAEMDVNYLIFVVMGAFLFGVFMLRWALWRCPNCGTELPMPTTSHRSVRSCWRCEAILQ